MKALPQLTLSPCKGQSAHGMQSALITRSQWDPLQSLTVLAALLPGVGLGGLHVLLHYSQCVGLECCHHTLVACASHNRLLWFAKCA